MVLKTSIFFVGIILLASCTEVEVTAEKKDLANIEVDGQTLYMNQCTVCHGPDGNLGNSGSKDLSKSTLDEAAILKIIKEGKGTMPPFEYLLTTDKEREAVMQYVILLRKEEK